YLLFWHFELAYDHTAAVMTRSDDLPRASGGPLHATKPALCERRIGLQLQRDQIVNCDNEWRQSVSRRWISRTVQQVCTAGARGDGEGDLFPHVPTISADIDAAGVHVGKILEGIGDPLNLKEHHEFPIRLLHGEHRVQVDQILAGASTVRRVYSAGVNGDPHH